MCGITTNLNFGLTFCCQVSLDRRFFYLQISLGFLGCGDVSRVPDHLESTRTGRTAWQAAVAATCDLLSLKHSS